MSDQTQNGTALMALPQQNLLALEPANFEDAWRMSKIAIDSGLMPKAVDRPEKVLLIYMRGREMGLTFMQALSSINVIEGKTSFSSELIVARVKQSPKCKYFRFIEGDDKHATYETWRIDEPEATRYTFTWEDAERLRLADKDNYKKQPKTMLRWRCATTLARIVYPEETLGLYSPDEAEDIVSGNDLALVPAKPVMDTELVPGAPTSPPPASSSAAPAAPAAPPAAAPAPAPAPSQAPQATATAPANGAEPLDQKEARFTKALQDATTKEQLDTLRPQLTALPRGPERDRLVKVYAGAQTRVAAAARDAKKEGPPATAPANGQLPLGSAPPAQGERQPGEDG